MNRVRFFPSSLRIRNWLDERHELRNIFANTCWLFADKVVRMGIGLFVNIWVARYLGPADFGILSYSQSFVFLFSAITTLGLDTIVIRELVRNDCNRELLLGTAFILKAAGGILSLLLLAIAVQFTHNTSYNNLLIFIIASAAIFQSFNVIDFYFQSQMASKYAVFSNISATTIALIVKIALILSKATLFAFAVVAMIESFILAICLITFYLKMKLKIQHWKYCHEMARNLLNHSWPLIISGLAISLGMRIDQILLNNMLGAQEVGIYAASVSLAEPLNFIGVIAAQGIFPYMIGRCSRAELNRSLLYFTRYTFTVMVLVAFLITMFSGAIISHTFGNTYDSSRILLMMLVWAPCLSFMSTVSNIYYVANNMTRVIALRQTILLIFNLILNVMFIGRYGAMGAAVTTLLSDLLLACFIELLSKDTREILFIKLKAVFFIRPVSEYQP